MTEHYTIISNLGEGSFGKCFLVRAESDNALLVIKQISIASMSRQEQIEVFREAKILEKLDHPNIVKFREVYKTKRNKLCIVMEYADGGDMACKLQNQHGVLMDEETVMKYFVQICLAIKHVHDRKILHRDIKSQNIFLMRNDRVKLGDFGISKILLGTHDQAHTMVGTPYYLSPEIVQSQPYSFKSDIWSLGILLYEMCTLQPPFKADSIHALAINIVKGKYQPLPERFSQEMNALVARMLSVNPADRPTIHELLWMPIIKSRITEFLTDTMRKVEFSHTVLHGANILAKGKAMQESPSTPQLPSTNLLLEGGEVQGGDTPAQNQEFMQKLEEAKAQEDKRLILIENVKQKQLTHTMKRDEFSAIAQKVIDNLRTEEEKKQQKEKAEQMISELDNQALIFDLQLALVQHPSEAVTVDIPEPSNTSTDREDDIPDSASAPSCAPRENFRNTSGLGKIEGMRSLLEDNLGTSTFVKAYNVIREISETVPPDEVNSDLYFERLRALISQDEIATIVPQIEVLMELEKEAGIYA